MIAMKYYTSTTQFNCGIDLHARQMYVCVMDRDGKKLVHTNIRNNDFEYFLKLVAPYRHDLTVCAECMFGWYWLADACQDAKLTFVLAHALYLKAIHGGKNKNDRIDSEKDASAHLLPLQPQYSRRSYVYPAEKRPLRALLRQRLLYVWNRSVLLARIQSHQLAYNRPTSRQNIYNRESWTEQLLASEADPVRQLALQNDLALIGHYDAQLASLEKDLLKLTKQTASRDFDSAANHPGDPAIISSLTLLHEIGDIARFPTEIKDFLSYIAGWSKGTGSPAPVKIKGLRGAKLGNPYLRWVRFGEAAVVAKRDGVLGPIGWQRLEARLGGNKFARPTPRCWPSNWPARSISCSKTKPPSMPTDWWRP